MNWLVTKSYIFEVVNVIYMKILFWMQRWKLRNGKTCYVTSAPVTNT